MQDKNIDTSYDSVAEKYDEFYSDSECIEENKFIRDLIKPHLVVEKKTLDIGCGTGLFNDLIDIDTLGLDPSEKMLEIARRKHLNVEFKCGRITELGDASRFGNVVSLFGSVSYLDEEENRVLKDICSHSDFYFFMHYKDGYCGRILDCGLDANDYQIAQKFGDFKNIKFYKLTNYVVITNREFNLEKWISKNT